MSPLPNFRTLHTAIVNAPPKPAGFPLQQLRDASAREALLTLPDMQPMLAQIAEEAERARATPPPPLPFAHFRLFETTGDRATWERDYFDRRRRLAALALSQALFPLSSGEGHIEPLSNLIWEICNEYAWALPAHLPVGAAAASQNRLPPEQVVDLFGSETAVALAESAALLGSALDPWLHYRIRQEIERRIFQPLFHNPVRFWWESAPMNWAAVCACNAGIAALTLVEDRERLAGMIDRVIRALESFLTGFPDDGGCPEGIGYWEYGFGYFVYFAETLRAFTGEALDLLADAQIRRIAAFPGKIALGDGRFVNFSDANIRTPLHAGLCAHVAARTHVEMPPLPLCGFHTDHCYRWMFITRDLLWGAPATGSSIADASSYLPDLAWVVDRRVRQGKVLAFAAKGGHNDEPHNHNDLGHFLLDIGGESLLADSGAGRYTRQYFNDELRYGHIHTGAQGHSLPLVNGAVQQAGAHHRAVPIAYVETRDGAHFALDLTAAYDEPALISLTRSFVWTVDPVHPAATLILTDTCRADAPLRVDECFISLIGPAVDHDGEEMTIVWRGERSEARLAVDKRRWDIETDAVPSEDHFGAAITVHRVFLRARAALTESVVELKFQCRMRD